MQCYETTHLVVHTPQTATELVCRLHVDVLTTHNMHVYILTISIIHEGGHKTHLDFCTLHVDTPIISHMHMHVLTIRITHAGLHNTLGLAQTKCRYTNNTSHAYPCTYNMHYAYRAT